MTSCQSIGRLNASSSAARAFSGLFSATQPYRSLKAIQVPLYTVLLRDHPSLNSGVGVMHKLLLRGSCTPLIAVPGARRVLLCHLRDRCVLQRVSSTQDSVTDVEAERFEKIAAALVEKLKDLPDVEEAPEGTMEMPFHAINCTQSLLWHLADALSAAQPLQLAAVHLPPSA